MTFYWTMNKFFSLAQWIEVKMLVILEHVFSLK